MSELCGREVRFEMSRDVAVLKSRSLQCSSAEWILRTFRRFRFL
jgi:hypothetical protein